jgi:hypothetical protein
VGPIKKDLRLLANYHSSVAEFRNTNDNKEEFVFIAGDHAVYMRSRAFEVKELRPVQEITKENLGNKDYVISLVDVEFSYAHRNEGGAVISIYNIQLCHFEKGRNSSWTFCWNRKPIKRNA